MLHMFWVCFLYARPSSNDFVLLIFAKLQGHADVAALLMSSGFARMCHNYSIFTSAFVDMEQDYQTKNNTTFEAYNACLCLCLCLRLCPFIEHTTSEIHQTTWLKHFIRPPG
jgi:hypothetical protein